MERISAALVRWGTAATVLGLIAYLPMLHWLGSTPEEAERDSVGVGLGLTLFAVALAIAAGTVTSVGALVLWYSALRRGLHVQAPYGNERVLGTAALLLTVAVSVGLWTAF